MHKTIKESCSFGDDTLSLEERATLGKYERSIWESVGKADAHTRKPAIRIELMSTGDVIRKIEIYEVVSGKTITTSFDGSCNPVKDESLSKNPDWERLAEQQRGKLPAFLAEIGLIQDPKDAFYHYAIQGKLKPGEMRSFEETTTIQEDSGGTYFINVPRRVATAMDFKKGNQVKWGVEGQRITVELMEKPRYISKIGRNGEYLVVNIRRDLLKMIELEKGKTADWYLPDSALIFEAGGRVRSRNFVMAMSPEIAKRKNLKEGDWVEQVIRGRQLILKPAPDGALLHFSKIGVVEYHTRINIPGEISDKLDKKIWGKGAEVSFEEIYHDHKQLVITPKEA
jgi:bifunctional DNA-binding transcriptional regulator/antitoxin component of YhaV-PrlF toxin-antitoxin module